VEVEISQKTGTMSAANVVFRYHRDGVGAINIYRKYTGENPLVVGQLACPTGVRFEAHLCCPARWNVHPVGKTA